MSLADRSGVAWWYGFTVEVLLLSFGMARKKESLPAPSASPIIDPVLATVHGVAGVSENVATAQACRAGRKISHRSTG